MTVLSGGDLGLQRATSHASFSGLPPKVDPTLSFSHGKYVDLEPKHGHFFIPPREIVGRYAEDTIDRPTYGKVGLGFLAVLFVASVVAAWFERRLFIVLTVAWGLAGTILTVALLFSYRYDTLIPANFGVRRLYDYAVIPPALVIPALIEAAAAPFARRRRFVIPAVAVAAGVLAVTAAALRTPGDKPSQRAEAGKKVFASVTRYVPCDARMLANTRTAGSWEAWTGPRCDHRRDVALPAPRGDGGGSCRSSWARTTSSKTRRRTRTTSAEQRVQYLVVVSPGIWFGWGGTGRDPQPDDAAKIAALPGVTPALP